MAKQAGNIEKQNPQPLEEKADPNLIKVETGNIPVLTVQLLNSINKNLGSLIGYLKDREMENERPKR